MAKLIFSDLKVLLRRLAFPTRIGENNMDVYENGETNARRPNQTFKRYRN
tara:strand:- start:260 stop:409 length:150 start_codon:yes stop_codon:yes gene_type:complete